MTAPPVGVKAPPLQLPGEHFIAATLFLIVGAAALWRISPLLAAGAYPAAEVVAVVHLFTLGWITTSIMGALYQFLPVALGKAIAVEWLGHVTFVLHVVGVTLMVAGIAAHHAVTLGIGLAVLGLAIAVFTGNLAATLRHAQRRGITWWALCVAVVFLVVALLAGIALAIHRFTAFLGTAHDLALRVHLHAALFGWMLLIIVGVSHRLLPMFLLSHGGGEKAASWAVGLIGAGAAMLSIFHHVAWLGREVPAVLMTAGLVAWIVQARIFYRHRHKPQLDPGLRLSAVAIVIFATAPLLLLRFAFPDVSAAWRMLYAGVLVASGVLFVAAQYYKIVPFLVWNRHFGPLAGTRKLPRVADLYAAREANVAIGLLAAGSISVLAGVGSSISAVIRAGAVVLTIGALVEARQLWDVSRRRP